MSRIEPRPLFVDTGPFYARFDETDQHHELAKRHFERLRTTDLLYRPVYTSRYILAETTRLLLYRVSHEAAVTALSAIRDGELFTVVTVDDDDFEVACDRFQQFDDQTISLVDHLSGALCTKHDIQHVFTFDPDDFETIGLTPIPRALDLSG